MDFPKCSCLGCAFQFIFIILENAQSLSAPKNTICHIQHIKLRLLVHQSPEPISKGNIWILACLGIKSTVWHLLPGPSVDLLGLALMEVEKHLPGKAEAGYSWIIP